MNILQVKKYYLYNQRRVIRSQVYLSLLEKALEKQTKTTESQGRKQVKPVEEHWKQMVESNKVTKIDFTIDIHGVSLRKQEEICNKL